MSDNQTLANQLIELADTYSDRFNLISYPDWHVKPAPAKWSKQEELGHLIDSAMTNLRRFVQTQYQEHQLIVYDQNACVTLQDYASAHSAELIDLFRLLNLQIARVWLAMPQEHWAKVTLCPEPITLQDLTTDYLWHVNHHAEHIIGEKVLLS